MKSFSRNGKQGDSRKRDTGVEVMNSKPFPAFSNKKLLFWALKELGEAKRSLTAERGLPELGYTTLVNVKNPVCPILPNKELPGIPVKVE